MLLDLIQVQEAKDDGTFELKNVIRNVNVTGATAANYMWNCKTGVYETFAAAVPSVSKARVALSHPSGNGAHSVSINNVVTVRAAVFYSHMEIERLDIDKLAKLQDNDQADVSETIVFNKEETDRYGQGLAGTYVALNQGLFQIHNIMRLGGMGELRAGDSLTQMSNVTVTPSEDFGGAKELAGAVPTKLDGTKTGNVTFLRHCISSTASSTPCIMEMAKTDPSVANFTTEEVRLLKYTASSYSILRTGRGTIPSYTATTPEVVPSVFTTYHATKNRLSTTGLPNSANASSAWTRLNTKEISSATKNSFETMTFESIHGHELVGVRRQRAQNGFFEEMPTNGKITSSKTTTSHCLRWKSGISDK